MEVKGWRWRLRGFSLRLGGAGRVKEWRWRLRGVF